MEGPFVVIRAGNRPGMFVATLVDVSRGTEEVIRQGGLGDMVYDEFEHPAFVEAGIVREIADRMAAM